MGERDWQLTVTERLKTIGELRCSSRRVWQRWECLDEDYIMKSELNSRFESKTRRMGSP
jgi:hypothetical protein